jgi:TPR repeat protein
MNKDALRLPIDPSLGESFVEIVLEEVGDWDMVYDRGRRMLLGMGLPRNQPRGAYLLYRAAKIGGHHAAAWDLSCLSCLLANHPADTPDVVLPAEQALLLPLSEQKEGSWQIDWNKATQIYQAHIEKEDKFALFNLGLCHYEGHGVEQSWEKAVALFKRAKKQSYLNGINSLGLCHYRGHGIPWNHEKAFKLFEKGAARGYCISQFNLAYCCENSRSFALPQNQLRSTLLYIRSSCQGDVAAFRQLLDTLGKTSSFGPKKVDFHIPTLYALCLAACRKRGVAKAIRVRNRQKQKALETTKNAKNFKAKEEEKDDIHDNCDDRTSDSTLSMSSGLDSSEIQGLPLDVVNNLNNNLLVCVYPHCERWFYGPGRVRWFFPIKTGGASHDMQKQAGEKSPTNMSFEPWECISSAFRGELHGGERMVVLDFCSIECHAKSERKEGF